MDLSRVRYISQSGDLFVDNVCDRCKQTPAISLEADCHGDSMTLCKDHWKEWFISELMSSFDKSVSNNFYEVSTPKKYEEYAKELSVKFYKYKI